MAALFIVLMSSSGLAFYNLQVFLHAFSERGALSTSAVGWAIGFFFVVNGFSGVATSNLLTRFPARFVIAGGGIAGGLCLSALGTVDRPVEAFALFGLFGLGFAATSLVPAMTVVTRWFAAKRSVAISIVSTGLSMGGIAVTPLCAYLIEEHGLAATAPWLGLAYVVGTVPLALLFVRDRPEEMGLHADGKESAPAGALHAQGVLFGNAVWSRYFVWLGLAYIAVMLAQVGAIQHLYNAVALRISTDFGRVIVATVALSSVVGRFSGGFLLLRAPIRPTAAVLMALQAAALFFFAMAEARTHIIISVVLFGLTVGNLLMIQPLLLAEAFGMRDYGRIYARSQLITTIGYALGPGLVASVAESTSYPRAFALAALASGIGLICLFFAGAPRSRF